MKALEHALTNTLHSVCLVCLFLQTMDDFAQVNTEFGRLFVTSRTRQPPARITLEVASKWKICVSALVTSDCTRPTILQVRSRSEWAPQCIGPYSQGSLVDEQLVLVSGQIPLVPATMELLEGSLADALGLCFQNASRVGS
jgi:enamine deaminase RidA (YjgF/YER057c/UK114 family)